MKTLNEIKAKLAEIASIKDQTGGVPRMTDDPHTQQSLMFIELNDLILTDEERTIWALSRNEVEAIYLAGKVGFQDWRHSIVDPNMSTDDIDDLNTLCRFPVVNLINDKHIYTGPYFVSCDHGCYHSNKGDHGVGAFSNGEDITEKIMQKALAKACLAAVQRSTIVFAWLDCNTCYGTISEIGMAAAARDRHIETSDCDGAEPKIVIAASPGLFLGAEDMWFTFALADHIILADDPYTAFKRLPL